MKLEDDKYCFVCGDQNERGLGLKFTFKEDNKLYTEFTPGKHHQGFKDITHGGIIGMILDEVMVNFLWKKGINVVSAEFSVRLKKSAPINKKLIFSGWAGHETGKIIYTESEVKNEEGLVIATASAKCVRIAV